MEAPPGPAMGTRREALPKHGQNINCGDHCGVGSRVIFNTLLLHMLYLTFAYNEHM